MNGEREELQFFGQVHLLMGGAKKRAMIPGHGGNPPGGEGSRKRKRLSPSKGGGEGVPPRPTLTPVKETEGTIFFLLRCCL